MYRTVLHPHPVSRFLSITVVALDLNAVRLVQVAGTDDPKPGTPPPDYRPGLVKSEDLPSVVAIFNGGFQPQHGRWGIMVHDRLVVMPPRVEGCTVALYGDGTVRIGSWPALADTEPDMTSYRQTPPCLVESGAVHPKLLAGNDKAWGGKLADLKTRRRSAIGIDDSGRVLLYGIGEEVDARYLAEGMRAAGAVHAAELDINWNWTRFLLVGKPSEEAELEITSTLVPHTPHGKREYVKRPSQRDFFYVVRRETPITR